jgi:hypothetical protein
VYYFLSHIDCSATLLAESLAPFCALSAICQCCVLTVPRSLPPCCVHWPHSSRSLPSDRYLLRSLYLTASLHAAFTLSLTPSLLSPPSQQARDPFMLADLSCTQWCSGSERERKRERQGLESWYPGKKIPCERKLLNLLSLRGCRCSDHAKMSF